MTPLCTRRLILAGLIAAPALSAPGAWAAPSRLTFHCFRKGTKIGEHRVSFSGSSDETIVDIDVAMKVMLGPITVLNYTHRAAEHWRAGKFESIDTHTVTNGAKQSLSAKRNGDSITADSSKLGHRVLPGAAAPMSHWNADAMHAPLFNPQDGRVMKVSCARSRGASTPPMSKVAGASRVIITGESEIVDWYDASGSWLGLHGKAADGSYVDYVRV